MNLNHHRQWLTDRLAKLFVEQDLSTVVNWMVAHRRRKKVILIGSGFSRNAERCDGLSDSVNDLVALWPDVARALTNAAKFQNPHLAGLNPLDAAEYCKANCTSVEYEKLLLAQVADDEIRPGLAHRALRSCRAKAIFTTNQLDTLLDKTGDRIWHQVRHKGELPSISDDADHVVPLVYLHGHRSRPGDWVFTDSEYRNIDTTHGILLNHLTSVLATHPLLAIGYSLSDPDFRRVLDKVSSQLGADKHDSLCITVGNLEENLPTRAAWLKRGVRFAHLSPVVAGSPTTSSVGAQMAAFLELDTREPPPEFVQMEIEALHGASECDTIQLRVDAFVEAIGEFKELEQFNYWLDERLFRSWVNCLPNFEVAKQEAEDLVRQWLDARASERASDNLSVVGQVRAPVRTLKHLPSTAFLNQAHLRASPLALAIDAIICAEGDAKIGETLSSVGYWLSVGLDRGIARNGARFFGSDYTEEVLVALLKWIIGELPEHSHDRSALRACLERTQSRLVLDEQTVLVQRICRRSPPGNKSLERAERAFWRNDLPNAFHEYKSAAKEAENLDQVLASWRATQAATSIAQRLWLDREYSAEQSRDAQHEELQALARKLHKLKQSREVERIRVAHFAIVNDAYEELARRSQRRPDGPGQTSRYFSDTVSRLWNLLVDEVHSCVYPEYLREPLTLARGLGVFEEVDALRISLWFALKETKDWLSQVPPASTISEQRTRDEAMNAFVREIAGGMLASLRGDDDAFPTSVLAWFFDAIPLLHLRLDADCSYFALQQLLDVRRELESTSHGVEYAFGSANLTLRFAQCVYPLIWSAAGRRSQREELLDFIREFLRLSQSSGSIDKTWLELHGAHWGLLLCDSAIDAGALIQCLVKENPPSDEYSSEVAYWLEAILEAIQVAKSLEVRLGPETRDAACATGRIDVNSKDDIRCKLARLALLAEFERTEAVENAVQLLVGQARLFERAGSGSSAERQRFKLCWAFAGAFERELIDRGVLDAAPTLTQVLGSLVAEIVSRPVDLKRELERELDVEFTLVVYAALFGIGTLASQDWLIHVLESGREPPTAAIGLIAEPQHWGDRWSKLVATLVRRANGNRVYEVLCMMHNATVGGGDVRRMPHSDLGWAIPLAVQQINNNDSKIVNRSALTIVELVPLLNEQDVDSPVGAMLLAGLRTCAEHPAAKVRVSVAWGLARMVHTGRTDRARQSARELVGIAGDAQGKGLANDHSGMIRALVQYGNEVGRIASTKMANDAGSRDAGV